MLDAIIAVFLIGMYYRLCIAFRSEVMPALLQFLLKLTIVIDFSIKDHKDTLIFVKNRLMTSREIDNRKTPHAQCNSISKPNPLIIWATVPNDFAHPIDKLHSIVMTTFSINKSSYSTH